MRRSPTKSIERYRLANAGMWSSTADMGANGAFQISRDGVLLRVLASDGTHWSEEGLPGIPWEHVSVSLMRRTPTWEEMDFVKRIFWRDDETVLQFHVPRAVHINVADTCLHLWKPIGVEILLPPPQTVGPVSSIVKRD